MFQPYLTNYETDKPMLPFPGKDFERMHQVLLQLVVKRDVLDACVSAVDLLKINLYIASTYLKVNDRHFGFSMEEQLKNLLHQDKIKSADVRNFKKEASNIVVPIVEKITGKNPLHFSECI